MKNQKVERPTKSKVVIGRQRTGKTAASLGLIAQNQKEAIVDGIPQRVFIYNPESQNEVFEKKSLILEQIRHSMNIEKLPGELKKITASQIKKVIDDSSTAYNWYIVTTGTFEEFCQEVKNVKYSTIYFDDLNNIVMGNVRTKRFKDFLEIFAGHRRRKNNIIITFHDNCGVPNALWTYFQVAIVKETDDTPAQLKTIGKSQSQMIQAQNEVRIENKKYLNPEGLFLAERTVWLNEQQVFRKENNELVTKIGPNKYRAVGDKIELIK